MNLVDIDLNITDDVEVLLNRTRDLQFDVTAMQTNQNDIAMANIYM